MKSNKTQFFKQVGLLFGLALFIAFPSCKEDDPIVEDPIASFQYEISTTNYLEVTFTNFSQNADSYAWDFGDGGSSVEADPVYTYAEAGTFTVELTAKNSADVSKTYSQTITITDPNEALKLLTGEVSKTWKLYRVGSAAGVGASAEAPRGYWALENDGKRPCVYYHEFTFGLDGSFAFDDNGIFWGEAAVFAAPLKETCFEAIAANMVNSDGTDVSAWLSSTNQFVYDAAAGKVTLNGLGAWIGMPQLGTSAESKVPESTRTFDVTIEENEGFDLMTVSYTYADLYWDFTYASYSNPALEPDVETVAEEWGEDLEDITPTQMFITFASKAAADMAVIDTVTSGSTVAFGVNDPADATAAKVGEFTRVAGNAYQELQFRAAPAPKDIQFNNFTSVKIDIFVPVNTDFTTLKRHFVLGFADQSKTQEWWNSPTQFVTEGDDVILGAWTTYTFDLADVKARTDLDMIYLGIGGGGHEAGGTFYVRNLIFE